MEEIILEEPSKPIDLEKMQLHVLRRFATEIGVNLKDLKMKKDIIAAVQLHLEREELYNLF